MVDYRSLNEDTVDKAITVGGLKRRSCVTRELPIHGSCDNAAVFGDLAHHGSDVPAIQELCRQHRGYNQPPHPNLRVKAGEVVWAARHEMVVRIEDFLSGRAAGRYCRTRGPGWRPKSKPGNGGRVGHEGMAFSTDLYSD
jgi:glycerol-3-phosphate dehydrogenase